MDWAALITWVITAGGGFVLLAIWLLCGGLLLCCGGCFWPAQKMSYFLLTEIGIVIWIVYIATDKSALAWIAFVLLLVVAVLGFTMFAIWLRQRGRRDEVAQPAEQHFPLAVVGLHGLLAATTLVLVFLAAAGVGS